MNVLEFQRFIESLATKKAPVDLLTKQGASIFAHMVFPRMPINFDVVIWHARQSLSLKALYTPGMIVLDLEA